MNTKTSMFLVVFVFKNINEIQEDMMELKPTFLAGVPRVYEKVHEGMIILAFSCVIQMLQINNSNDCNQVLTYAYQVY